MKKLHFYTVLVLFLSVVSCDKKELPYEQLTDSKEGAFISLPRAHKGVNQIQVFPVQDERTFVFSANFGALGLPASEISISVEEDLRAFDSINDLRELNGLDPYIRFPRGSYALDTRDMVISPGKMSSSPITMTYYPPQFDLDTDYLLALSITKSSGYAVDPASKTILIGVHKREPHRIFVNSTIGYLDAGSTNATEQFLFDLGLDIANTLPRDVKVTLSEDQTLFQSVNDERISQGLPPLEPFPSDAYTLDKSVLTIAAGARASDQGILTYRPGMFDANKSYLLALTISDASGYTIDSDQKTILVRFAQEEIIDRTGWIATASSSHPGQPVTQLIDGDLTTFWHSNYSGSTTQFPHWASFDMGTPKEITGVRLHPRHNNDTGLTQFRLQKYDGTEWVFITPNLTFNPHRDSGWQLYRIEPQQIQQIRVYMTGSGNPPFTHFAEFEVLAFKD